jgi:2',3'-cyclic-nucleotide 2'-phosphodiesterase (5'-nucleotidase family)
MKYNLNFTLILISFLAGVACNTSYRSSSMKSESYKISDSLQKDSSIIQFLQPYSINVDKTMNGVVGIADENLDKGLPESKLGNFMVDAMFNMAEENYGMKVDAAFLNQGGIRLNQLAAGEVTVSKIFEVMPFDNILIIQKLKGDVLLQFLDLIASLGGWPVAGIAMQIKNKKAVNVMVGGLPIDLEKEYVTANSDFVANGGENADMLKPFPQIINGYLVRDALFDYIKRLKSQGKNISAKIEKRVTNVE